MPFPATPLSCVRERPIYVLYMSYMSYHYYVTVPRSTQLPLKRKTAAAAL